MGPVSLSLRTSKRCLRRLPNKRLKLTGPAVKGIVRLFPAALTMNGRVPCAHQHSPRSLSAIR